MKKILVLVEGQTEETFIKQVLVPHLSGRNIYCIPTLAVTKRVKSGSNFKGGITSYDKVKNDILRLLKDSSANVVTTMIDYYGFNQLAPFKGSVAGRNCFEKVSSLEALFKEDIKNPKFRPYLELHEFEAMVFVSPDEIIKTMIKPEKAEEINDIKNQFTSPEEIDDGPKTAPSKRLERIFPSYRKTLHSTMITSKIGLENIRSECKHFDNWVKMIETMIL